MGDVITDWSRLRERLDTERCGFRATHGREMEVVSTNGVFDLLHVGHVRLLREARSRGDLLVVAINSDASTRSLKGPSRPYVPQADRAELLAGLACVDLVTVFDEPTPEKILDVVRPSIHIKGSDYEAARIPERAVVELYGGRVETVALAPGRSSSALAARIREDYA